MTVYCPYCKEQIITYTQDEDLGCRWPWISLEFTCFDCGKKSTMMFAYDCWIGDDGNEIKTETSSLPI